jgi:hypothetical protein
VQSRVIVLLARAPSAKGKTRLTAHLSEDRARQLRERLFLDTLASALSTRLPVVIAFTPEDARADLEQLVPGTRLIAQRGSDLGDRMRFALLDALDQAREAVLIGSDLPTLPARHLLDAFEMLESGADVVFGPTRDGGFYLVGARQRLPDIFSGVVWSRSDVLTNVIDAAHRADLVVGLAREWHDVDEPRDLEHLTAWYTTFLA